MDWMVDIPCSANHRKIITSFIGSDLMFIFGIQSSTIDLLVWYHLNLLTCHFRSFDSVNCLFTFSFCILHIKVIHNCFDYTLIIPYLK